MAWRSGRHPMPWVFGSDGTWYGPLDLAFHHCFRTLYIPYLAGKALCVWWARSTQWWASPPPMCPLWPGSLAVRRMEGRLHGHVLRPRALQHVLPSMTMTMVRRCIVGGAGGSLGSVSAQWERIVAPCLAPRVAIVSFGPWWAAAALVSVSPVAQSSSGSTPHL